MQPLAAVTRLAGAVLLGAAFAGYRRDAMHGAGTGGRGRLEA